jgi:hypothetical protein
MMNFRQRGKPLFKIILIGLAATTAMAAGAESWVDTKTGETVVSGPVIAFTAEERQEHDLTGTGWFRTVTPELGDPKRAYDPVSGRNFVFDKDKCSWLDVKTGERVASGPAIAFTADERQQFGFTGTGWFRTVPPEIGDRNRAYDSRSGRNFVRQPPCGKTSSSVSLPPPSPPPAGKFYVGVGGSYFFEPDTKIGLVTGTLGYRILPNVGIEVQGDVGVTKEKFDNGSTFKSSTGIDWSLYPTVAGYLPVSDTTDLILHFGYGVTRFGSKATSFSGSSSSSFEDHETVGTAILGGGADIGINGDSSLRVEYDRLFFDNGSEGNRVSLSFVHTFGLHVSELTGVPGPGGNPGAVPPPPPTPPPPAPPPPPPPE